MSVNPNGIVAILTAPDGHVVATATDFDRSSSGGVSMQEAQEYRAKMRLKREAVAAYCSGTIVAALDQYLIERIVERLVSSGGHKLTVIPVGGDKP